MRRLFIVSLALTAALYTFGTSYALDIPDYTSPVTDLTGSLTAPEIQRLNASISAYRRASSIEIGILIIPSLEDRSLEDFSHDVFAEWGLGKADKDNGVLFLVAFKEHAARLEVGYGLEGDLTDVEAGRIVSRNSGMAGRFRAGDFSGGIQAVMEGIKLGVDGG